MYPLQSACLQQSSEQYAHHKVNVENCIGKAKQRQPWPQARPPGSCAVAATRSVIVADPTNTELSSPISQNVSPLFLLEDNTYSQASPVIRAPFSDTEVLTIIPSDIGRLILEQSLRSNGSYALATDTSNHEQGIWGNKSTHTPQPKMQDEYLNGRRCNVGRQKKGSILSKLSKQGIHQDTQEGKEFCQDEFCYGDLSIEGQVFPSIFVILTILQRCRKENNSSLADKFYLQMCEIGLDIDMVVGNHLVPMLVECGSLGTAHLVFSRLLYWNEHSWSFLVLGYSMIGELQHAFDLYTDMQKANVHPTNFTFIGLLRACATFKDVNRGRIVHNEIKEKGFAVDVLVGNTLVDMYAKCGLFTEAEEAFEQLPVQDVVSWTALIAGYIEHELGQEALDLYRRMPLKGVSPNAVTITCAMKACGIIEAVEHGLEIHHDAIAKGFESDTSVSNSLASMYINCGCLDEAHNVFDNLQVRDVVSWNAVMVGYTEHGPYDGAVNCYTQMQYEEISPDAITFSCVLKACASTSDVELGKDVHMRSSKLGYEGDLSVSNSLIGMYGRCGFLLEAREVFDKIHQCDIVSWTSLITGYVEHNIADEALICFTQMQESGLCPNAVTISCALKACGMIGTINKGYFLHTQAIKKGFSLQPIIANTLVSMYATCGFFLEALEVFENIPAPNVVSWTALIGGHADCGYDAEALDYFDKMQVEGVSPNAITFSCTLKACGSLGSVEKGQEVHMLSTCHGFEMHETMGGALVSMYARCGLLPEACHVFDSMPVCNVEAWSAMIKGYAMNHEGSLAIRCFDDMQQHGVRPDCVTFTCFLTACSHAGLTCEGQECFRLMRESYGVMPTGEHFSCMVDLLARSGDLYRAESFLEALTPSSEDAWAALLSACKANGEVELGLRCFEQLVMIHPGNAAWYVLMTDIFVGVERWVDADAVEKMRKHVEAKKKPASAVIEVNGRIHEFRVGIDQTEDVLAMVQYLNSCLKDAGHVPNLDLVARPIADPDKEAALCEHAEKLAIAFGLLNTPQGTTLRVSKNLRMCTDCHNASKVISRVERREIVLRDDCCVHHFKDGLCVCGDMF